MTHHEARVKAEEAIADMQSMNVSYEHPASKAKAFFAGTVIDLCSQLAAYDEIPAVEARLTYLKEKAAADAKAAKAAAAAKKTEDAAKADAHVGAVGGE
jgi:hypothetical protein